MSRSDRLNIGLSFAIAATFILVSLVVTFLILHLTFTPYQIVQGYLPEGHVDPAFVQQMIHELGLDQPLFFQFFRFLGDFLSGNLGISSSINQGQAVIDLLMPRTPRTVEVLFLPLCISVGLGYFFGRISNRSERNWSKNTIQLFSALFLAVPVFFFGMFLQYTLGYLPYIAPSMLPQYALGSVIFPTTGFKNYAFPNPPFVTGSRLLDSMLSFNWLLFWDTLFHYVLPMIVLTVTITALMTRFFSSRRVKDSYKKRTILSHTAKTSAGFGIILTYIILIETTFGLVGFGEVLIQGIRNMDYFVLRACLFVIIVLFGLTLLVSNLVFSLYGLRKDIVPQEELEDTTEREFDLSGKGELKQYLTQIVKSPLTIIGLVAVLVPIILSIFPELISGVSYEAANGVYFGAWGPPSPEHLLGQTEFGRDVFARCLYGVQDSLLFGVGAVLIGLIGGMIFGPLASKFTRIIPTLTRSVMLVFYILPAIVLVMLSVMIGGQRVEILVIVTGLLLIPGFTKIIANTEFRVVPIGKKIITYAPLFAGFAIMLYMSLGYIGLTDPRIIQLGNEISEARIHMYDAPWATFWPGITIVLILASLYLLHEGLAQHSR